MRIIVRCRSLWDLMITKLIKSTILYHYALTLVRYYVQLRRSSNLFYRLN